MNKIAVAHIYAHMSNVVIKEYHITRLYLGKAHGCAVACLRRCQMRQVDTYLTVCQQYKTRTVRCTEVLACEHIAAADIAPCIRAYGIYLLLP